MSTHTEGLPADLAAIPIDQPKITVTPSNTKVGSIQCLEFQWIQMVPRVGERTIKAFYDLQTSRLDIVEDLLGIGTSDIHGIECVQVQRTIYRAEHVWRPEIDDLYCRMTSDQSELLAVQLHGQRLQTFKDAGFMMDWGGVSSHDITDDGRFLIQPDGSYRLASDKGGFGAGTWMVTIGARTFLCLRAIEPVVDEREEIGESFIDQASGRTVLYRQYRGRQMRYVENQDPLERNPDERFPNNRRIIINDCVFVQSNCTGRAHDMITATSLGLSF